MGFGRNMRTVGAVCALGVVALAAPVDAGSGGDQWTSAGGNRANTRSQPSDHGISVANAGDLA